MEKVTYKSFCWNFGTTSFRTKDFNLNIEKQLFLLDKFRKINNSNWIRNNNLQIDYYEFLKKENFITGNASRKDKDAREKTSGLVELGLINDNRFLTKVGVKLLDISIKNKFESKNELYIPNDSYLYLKQLLKTSYNISKETIRPFILLVLFLLKFDYLTYEEFTYLLPLCIDKNSIELIIKYIDLFRNGKIDINTIIYNILISMDNYKLGLNILLNNKVTEELICNIGINRKSGSYDKFYFNLYNELFNIYILNKKNVDKLYEVVNNLNLSNWWKNYLFKSKNKLKKNEFDNIHNEMEFKGVFYKYLHIFKAKATLKDYFDLNKRYVGISDIILFNNEKIQLDLLPKYIFKYNINNLKNIVFSESLDLENDVELKNIIPNFYYSVNAVLNNISDNLGVSINKSININKLIEKNNLDKFNNLINSKFKKEKLIKLLEYYENNNIKEIQKEITNNADAPTIFEYIIGIIWYNISERKGNILKFMKLSLDANMLPKSHAVGGEADIVYEYEKTNNYPKHDLLIEATLTEKTNQRRNEMEPVSRHLGEHISNTNNKNDYCVFITNSLFLNVISDFRGRKNFIYYDNNQNKIKGLKIIPFEIKILKDILNNDIKYNYLYSIFEEAYKLDDEPKEWYEKFKELMNKEIK